MTSPVSENWEYLQTVATKIKLMRLGKMRAPYYRIVVADARTKRDGRSIEMIGKYHPKEDPSFIEVDSERAQYWLGVGAQPTEAVAAILRVTGDWQKFKGEPAPPPMKVKEPKADKKLAFQAASLESSGEPADGATTPKRKSPPKAAKADSPAAAAEPDSAVVSDSAAASETPTETAPDTSKAAPETAEVVPDTAEVVPDTDKAAPDTAEAGPETASSSDSADTGSPDKDA